MTQAHDAAGIFGDRAAGYGRMTWHDRYAHGLVDSLALESGMTVLDAGAGTGFASRALARRIGTDGRVIAVELTPSMAERLDPDAGPGAAPIEVVVGDATRLDLPDAAVDAVVCSAALLYMPVAPALAEWFRVLRPGGTVGFSTMRVGHPPAAALFRRIAAEHGLALADPAEALGSERQSVAVLRRAGFADVQVIAGTVEFGDSDLEGAWEAHERGAREALATLPERRRVAFRDRYVAELAALPGRHLAEVLYASARKPVLGAVTGPI